ncbi:MAG: helicase HerA-like domain-containing protein, partial [Ferruginibacter sp.]
DAEVTTINAKSKLVAKYSQDIDSNSAYEIITAKLQEAENNSAATTPGTQKTAKPEPSMLEKVVDNTVVKSMMRTAGNGIVRGLLGVLGLGGRTRSSTTKKSSWF